MNIGVESLSLVFGFPMMIPLIIGAFIGAYFLRNVPGMTIRRIVGLIAVIAGGRMLIGR